MIDIKNLVHRYTIWESDTKKSKKTVLDDVTLDISPGQLVAILGPNGSGKSTLAKHLNVLLLPDEGTVWIDGKDTKDAKALWDIRSTVGMVFQNPDNQFVGATVEDDVAFGMENQGIPREEMIKRVDEALLAVNMLDFKTREPARLSGGQKQRVAVAGIIALRPEIIILDESTSMLDPTGRSEIMRVIHEIKDKYHLTVLSITHDLDEAASSDRILVMRAGEIIKEAAPSELFATSEDMVEIGLDVPFSSNLMKDLRTNGFDLPEKYLSEDELVELLADKLG